MIRQQVRPIRGWKPSSGPSFVPAARDSLYLCFFVSSSAGVPPSRRSIARQVGTISTAGGANEGTDDAATIPWRERCPAVTNRHQAAAGIVEKDETVAKPRAACRNRALCTSIRLPPPPIPTSILPSDAKTNHSTTGKCQSHDAHPPHLTATSATGGSHCPRPTIHPRDPSRPREAAPVDT